MILGVIPARLKSTRLEEKVLKPIAGRPMIYHVWQRAKKAKLLSDVVVACDDARIAACVKDFGGRAVLTRADHPNGTSRIAEVAVSEQAEILINIQGDEPLIHPENIDRLAGVLQRNPELPVATLAVRKNDPEEFENPNVVKVVCDEKSDALYFSRAPVPFPRKKGGEPLSYLKHLGIYGYRKEFLLNFVTWKPGKLEQLEQLEQLRILERGFPVRVEITEQDSVGVDTMEDLKVVEMQLEAQ